MAAPKKPRVPATPRPSKPRFVFDEIHVQVVVRELDPHGETVAKHTPEPLRFVNERQFREWAQQPFSFVDQRGQTPA
jgi:hypothetical protein